jgi:hypothetical protein
MHSDSKRHQQKVEIQFYFYNFDMCLLLKYSTRFLFYFSFFQTKVSLNKFKFIFESMASMVATYLFQCDLELR